MKNKILYWQIIGAIFIILFGSFLHFLFELSGNFFPVGAISAVNESVWEHLKLGYWPLVFFGLIEYRFLRDEVNNYFLAKLISALFIIIAIPVFFYSYTSITGENILLLDLLSFFISVLIAQGLSYKILKKSEFGIKVSYGSLIGIVIIGCLFVIFTYFPPHIPLFQDSLTGIYGIP